MEFEVVKLINNAYLKFADKLEKYLVLLTVLFFIGGIFLAKYWNAFGKTVSNGANAFIDGYAFVAPVAIFLILAPAVAKMLKSNSGKFGVYAVKWLAIRRLFATIFAVFFTVIVFGFPLLPTGDISIMAAVTKALKTVLTMFYSSPFMLAIWVGLIAALISVKVNWLYKILSSISDKFELVGQYFMPMIPLFMVAVGAYIYYLPNSVGEMVAVENFKFSALNVLGYSVNANSAGGLILVYFVAAFLVGIACFIWHFTLLAFVKWKDENFSIKKYFKNYWIRVYPLLWATSSEALAVPLNLYLTKKHFPYVKKVVRRFVVGMGSYLNINGTLICVIVLGGVVVSLLGIRPSMVEWLLAIPIVFILGYGVPGIPGELVLFAGPIAVLLGLPTGIASVFIALYVGLQIGLPDSFRTGSNSTDNCLCAVLLNTPYEEKFMAPLYNQVEQMVEDDTFTDIVYKKLYASDTVKKVFASSEFKYRLKNQLAQGASK